MANYEDKCVLYCDRQKYQRYMKWDPKKNMDHLQLAAGAYHYGVFTSTP